VAIRAILFDLAETLGASGESAAGAVERCFREGEALLASEGMALPPGALRAATQKAIQDTAPRPPGYIQLPTPERLAIALATLGLQPEPWLTLRLVDVLLAWYDEAALAEPRDQHTQLAIRRLRQMRIPLGCVTNSLRPAVKLGRVLELRGLAGCFEIVVTSADVGHAKPHPAPFTRALDNLGVLARDVMFVGDSPAVDIAGAKAIGMTTVLTHQFRKVQPACEDEQPHHVIAHLHELPNYVEQQLRYAS
jgi:HAD superfamily hydrolase (TIGR01549 family)